MTTNGRSLLGLDRLHVLWETVRNVARLGLPAVEVGTYRGGSAYFIAGAFRTSLGRDIEFHVFDTFEGHAEETISAADATHHPAGHFGDAAADDVREYLSAYDDLHVHVGNVMETMFDVMDKQFGFVHIDVDLRIPTAACLEFFGQRVPVGGALVVDDYGAKKCPGVKTAVTKYLRTPAGQRFQFWRIAQEQAVLVAVGAAE